MIVDINKINGDYNTLIERIAIDRSDVVKALWKTNCENITDYNLTPYGNLTAVMINPEIYNKIEKNKILATYFILLYDLNTDRIKNKKFKTILIKDLTKNIENIDKLEEQDKSELKVANHLVIRQRNELLDILFEFFGKQVKNN